jgi:hypothetical protein
MQQKLLTIYLDNSGYKREKLMVGTYGDLHGHVEEHLQSYLADGWTIQAVHGFGGNADGITVRGWLTVVLQK